MVKSLATRAAESALATKGMKFGSPEWNATVRRQNRNVARAEMRRVSKLPPMTIEQYDADMAFLAKAFGAPVADAA